MKTKSQLEPQKLDFSMKAGKPSKLEANEDKRAKRRAMLEKEFNKYRKDPF